MLVTAFLLGLVCGLCCVFLVSSCRGWLLKLRNPMGDDEKYLMTVARATGGRLIVAEEATVSGPPLLKLRELPHQRELLQRDQVQRLMNRGLLKPDPSGLPGRYLVTPEGWAYVKHLPVILVDVQRPGSWFNSVSRRVKVVPKR